MFDSMTEQIRPMHLFRYTAPAERRLDEITRRWGNEEENFRDAECG